MRRDLRQFDKVYAKFKPVREDDLKPSVKVVIGYECIWEAMWLIESGEYKGEWAMMSLPGVHDQVEFGFEWVPSCDLREAYTVVNEKEACTIANEKGKSRMPCEQLKVYVNNLHILINYIKDRALMTSDIRASDTLNKWDAAIATCTIANEKGKSRMPCEQLKVYVDKRTGQMQLKIA